MKRPSQRDRLSIFMLAAFNIALAAPLPMERVHLNSSHPTEHYIQSYTSVMSTNPSRQSISNVQSPLPGVRSSDRNHDLPHLKSADADDSHTHLNKPFQMSFPARFAIEGFQSTTHLPHSVQQSEAPSPQASTVNPSKSPPTHAGMGSVSDHQGLLGLQAILNPQDVPAPSQGVDSRGDRLASMSDSQGFRQSSVDGRVLQTINPLSTLNRVTRYKSAASVSQTSKRHLSVVNTASFTASASSGEELVSSFWRNLKKRQKTPYIDALIRLGPYSRNYIGKVAGRVMTESMAHIILHGTHEERYQLADAMGLTTKDHIPLWNNVEEKPSKDNKKQVKKLKSTVNITRDHISKVLAQKKRTSELTQEIISSRNSNASRNAPPSTDGH